MEQKEMAVGRLLSSGNPHPKAEGVCSKLSIYSQPNITNKLNYQGKAKTLRATVSPTCHTLL